MRIFAFVLALVASAAFAADLSKEQRAEIEARIQSYSHVCATGDENCAGAGVAAVASGPRSGEEVYNGACMACHATGAAGAPKVGDAAAWATRIDKGMEALYASGVNGVPGTGMMARGGCGDCSDEDIYAAVDYMVDNSK